jgi:hypothetical protein
MSPLVQKSSARYRITPESGPWTVSEECRPRASGHVMTRINVVDSYESVKRSVGGAISVTRSRSSFLLESGASVISRGCRRAVQA